MLLCMHPSLGRGGLPGLLTDQNTVIYAVGEVIALGIGRLTTRKS